MRHSIPDWGFYRKCSPLVQDPFFAYLIFMKCFLYSAIVSVFVLILSASLYAQEKVQVVSFFPEPSAASLALGTSDSLSDRDIMLYAFMFSGADKTNVTSYLARYEDLATELSTFLFVNGGALSDEQKAELILDFLYSGTLKKYSLNQTRLTAVFDSGVYNCVSSAVLYFALALRSGFDVRGVKTRDHAFCAVTIDGKSFDVETTNKYGFDPGNKKEFTNAFGQTGFAYTPPSHYRGRSDIDGRALLCLILQNRIADSQKKRDFLSSLSFAVDMYAALPTEESLDQLFNECANYAASLDAKREYENALIFLTRAAARFGSGKPLFDAADKIYYNQFAACFDKRLTSTDEGLSRQIALADTLYERYAQNTLVSVKTKIEVRILLYNGKAARFFENEDWRSLFSLIDQAKLETGNAPGVLRLEKTTLQNVGIRFHNKFAAFFNKGDYISARAVLEQGLALVPGSNILLNDYNRIRELPPK